VQFLVLLVNLLVNLQDSGLILVFVELVLTPLLLVTPLA